MTKRLCVLCAFGLVGLPLVLSADPVTKRIEVTFNQAVEMRGMVFAPGSYIINPGKPTPRPRPPIPPRPPGPPRPR